MKKKVRRNPIKKGKQKQWRGEGVSHFTMRVKENFLFVFLVLKEAGDDDDDGFPK